MRSTDGIVNQPVPVGKKLPESVTDRVGGRPGSGPTPCAASSRREAISSASRCTACPAYRLRTAGGNATLTSTPTAAPMSVSTSRFSAAASAPAVNPTPSTSIALIGTSMRFGPSRSSWPTTIAAAIRMREAPPGEADDECESDGDRHPGEHAEHALHAAAQRAGRRGLHDEQRRQRRDQRGRVVQAQRLGRQVGRDGGAREACGAEGSRAPAPPDPHCRRREPAPRPASGRAPRRHRRIIPRRRGRCSHGSTGCRPGASACPGDRLLVLHHAPLTVSETGFIL